MEEFYVLSTRRRLVMEFLCEPLKENSIFMDLKTVLLISKILGLLPIFEQITYYKITSPSRSNACYSFFIRGLVYALTTFQLYNIVKPNSSQWYLSQRPSDIRNKWIEIILSITTFCTTVFFCGRNGDTFLKIINEILEVDEEIYKRYRKTIDNKCEFSVKFLLIIFICLTYIGLLRIFNQLGNQSATTYILTGFLIIKICLPVVFIVFTASLLRIVRLRFAYLNLILTGYTYKMKCLSIFTPVEKFPEDSLFTFDMHNKLLGIYRSIKDCCSPIIICYMGLTIYTITTNTYNSFVQITLERNSYAQVIQWAIVWIVLHTSILVLFSKICDEITKEANTTGRIVSRIYCKSKKYQQSIDKFLIENLKQEVQFTVYGFFVVDNETLFKIFAAVATYLVILIQFNQLEEAIMGDQIK